uniref:Disease resistance protein RxCC-like-NB-ARC n=1 Tax=Vitis pseudoreticulata TaxID=231512 RepID=A0A0K2GV22_VITPS|nr:disease resistance protein RxCC-like-NB-ARC [Vitis pseudoreticulata]
MADGNITFFLEKLGNFVVQEASLFGEVEGQVRLLRNEMEWMRLVLEDADIDTKCNHDRRLKLWVNQIRDVAYDAEDVIDEFMFKIEHQRQRRPNRFLPTCVRFADKLPFIHELDGRIREINITIEKILANKDRYNIESGIPSEAGSSSSTEGVVQRGKRVPIVEEADVVGMTGDAEAVKQMLVEEESESRVVAIVGMGGLGKTTLAKKVYNHSEVNHHFECRALGYVSQDYRIRELLKEIAHSINLSPDNMDEKQLGEVVNGYLKDKRYLIVLDDVWSIQVWHELSPHLPESNKRRVLITTRNQQIGLDAYAKLYELRPLGEKESWELFLKKTFPIGSTSPGVCPEELEDLGKKITEKCKGLPLAIVVSGGLLSRKEKTKSSWEKILKSMEWHLSQGPESCLGILALSYSDLPYFLKSCFLYCGVFPEDCQIKASKLMQIWIAEGFVQGRGEEMVEDVAEEYLEELIHGSMIQVAGRKWDGRVKSCRIHDLLRDLAISKARDSKIFELEFLRLKELPALEELKVEDGAMPTLKTLQIVHCNGMKTLLHELLKLKNPQRVNLESMNGELIQEIETTEGEEFDKIRGITSIN